MAKFNYVWDEKRISKYIKEGRGQGEFENYKPWLTVRDVPSSGRITRLPGKKINRVHHLLSDLERSVFLLYEWNDRVIDIREQFPILDRDKTFEISEVLGFVHPKDPKTQTNIVITVDLLLTVKEKDGKIKNIARSVKPFAKLMEKRTLEKLLIEKYYFNHMGIDWAVVTEKDFPKAMSHNLLEIRDAYLYINEEDEEVLKYVINYRWYDS